MPDVKQMQGEALGVISTVKSQLKFMRYCVDDLFDHQKMDEEIFTLRKQPFDVIKLTEEICSIFRPQTIMKDLDIFCQVDHTIDI